MYLNLAVQGFNWSGDIEADYESTKRNIPGRCGGRPHEREKSPEYGMHAKQRMLIRNHKCWDSQSLGLTILGNQIPWASESLKSGQTGRKLKRLAMLWLNSRTFTKHGLQTEASMFQSDCFVIEIILRQKMEGNVVK